MQVRKGDAAVVLFFELVRGSAGRGVAALPELLDEAVALSVGGEFLKGFALIFLNDIDHIFVHPAAVGGGHVGLFGLICRLRRRLFNQRGAQFDLNDVGDALI